MILIYVLILFFSSQIYLNKAHLPKKYAAVKFRYYLLLAISLIIFSVILGQLVGFSDFWIVTATVLSSSLLIYRFQFKYAEMERGK